MKNYVPVRAERSSFRCHRRILLPSVSKLLLLSSPSSIRNPDDLRKLHAVVVTSGLNRFAFIPGKFIARYARLGDPASCLSVFRDISPTHNVYHWNSIIRALTQNTLFRDAIGFYSQMRGRGGVFPDAHTLPSVLNACAGLGGIRAGRVVHGQVFEMGFGPDLYIGNALIDMYGRFRDVGSAWKVFDGMRRRDVVSWNSLIAACTSNECWEEALECYFRMRTDGVMPDLYTVSSVLPACGSMEDVDEGRLLHCLAEKIGLNEDFRVMNGVLGMYFKFGSLADARKLFDEMVVRDDVSWNTLICGLCGLELFEEAIKFFTEMIGEFTPDLLTSTSVLHACGRSKNLEMGKFVHLYMVEKGMELDTRANNILLDMYIKCSDLQASREFFVNMENRDIVSWNSLIHGFVLCGLFRDAMQLFSGMMTGKEVDPDSVTYVMLLAVPSRLLDNFLGKEIHCQALKLGFSSDLCVNNALIDMYAKCGETEDSLRIFDVMGARSVITWNTVIASCVHDSDSHLGFKVVRRMAYKGVAPDVATFVGLLPICSMLAAKRQGKEIHGRILRLGFEKDTPIGNALIEMYSKCGSLDSSIRVFDCLKDKDMVSWTSLVSAYGNSGLGRKALETFAEMQTDGINPDHVALVAILDSCSHSGLVDEGLHLFHSMKNVHGLEPQFEHYSCIVDLLSRSGQFAKAEEFIESMPVKANATVWGALLSACREMGDVEIAERVSRRIAELGSDDPGYHVLVSNVYASLGRWDRVGQIRKSIRSKGMRKDPGRSWTEVDGGIDPVGRLRSCVA